MTTPDQSRALGARLLPTVRLLWFAFDAFRDAPIASVRMNGLRQMRRYSAELMVACHMPGLEDCAALAQATGEVLDHCLTHAITSSAVSDVLAPVMAYLRQRQQTLHAGEATADAMASHLRAIMEQLHRFGASTVTVPGEQSVRAGPNSDRLNKVSSELRHRFVAEIPQDIARMRQLLLECSAAEDPVPSVAELRAVAHRLRGTGATMSWTSIAEIAHLLEGIAEEMQSSPDRVSALSDLAQQLVGLLEAARDQAQRTGQEAPALVSDARQLCLLYGGLPSGEGSRAAGGSRSDPRPVGPHQERVVTSSMQLDGPSPVADEAAAAGLRVEAQRLDELLAQATALSARGQALHSAEEQASHLLNELSRAIERAIFRVEALADRHAQTSENSTVSHESIISLKEAVEDSAVAVAELRALGVSIRQASQDQENLTAELQGDLMHLRLVSLRTLLPLMAMTVKVAANDQGKRVRLTAKGAEAAVDREVSEVLAEPLFQLVRNAVTHGIESPDTRMAAGKNPEGHVWFSARHLGNELHIEIGDDGRGVDLDHVREAAVRAGIQSPDDARRLSARRATELIFEQGITTWPQADLAAGRGIGLSQVRQAIQDMKGSVEVSTTPGQGTVFQLRIPVSLRVARALIVQAGGEHFALPGAYLDRVLDAPKDWDSMLPAGQLSVPSDEQAQSPSVADVVQLRAIDDVLGREQGPLLPAPAIVLLRYGGKRLALAVDAIGEQRELAVRTLPPFLRRPLMRSAVLAPDGHVVLMLDIPTMFRHIAGVRAAPSTRPRSPNVSRLPRVLLVDDSLSVRRSVGHDLAQHGFEVETARDGLAALQAIVRFQPHVIVLDIEMPRLDGFELLQTLRDTGQFAQVKVVILTAHVGENSRMRAQELGAHDFVHKPVVVAELATRVHALIPTSSSVEATDS